MRICATTIQTFARYFGRYSDDLYFLKNSKEAKVQTGENIALLLEILEQQLRAGVDNFIHIQHAQTSPDPGIVVLDLEAKFQGQIDEVKADQQIREYRQVLLQH